MKTAGRENPNHGVAVPRNRAHGAVGQNRSCSIKWAAKQEKVRPWEGCFFLTSTFIELIGTLLTEWLDGTSQAERNWLYLTTRGFAPIPNYPQYLRLNVSHDCVRPLPRIGLFHPLQHAGLSRPLRFASIRPRSSQPTLLFGSGYHCLCPDRRQNWRRFGERH